MAYIIYVLVDPRTKEWRYIGQTTRILKERLREHLSKRSLAFEDYKSKWIRSLLKLGLNPMIEVLEEVNSIEKLNEAEQEWIAECRKVGVRLTNLTDGGFSFLKGKKKPSGFGEKVAKNNSARVWRDESRIKTARSLGGKPFVDNLGNQYETNMEAARKLGLYEANIRHVLKGRLKTTGGYTFKYIE